MNINNNKVQIPIGIKISYLPKDIRTPLNKYKKQSLTLSIIFVLIKNADSLLISSLVLKNIITSLEKIARENDTILNKKKLKTIQDKKIVDFLYYSFPIYFDISIPKYS